MGMDNGQGAETPAWRLALMPGVGAVVVLTLCRHAGLRIRVPVETGRSRAGETTLPTGCVRTLCTAPATAPLHITAAGTSIEMTLGQAAARRTSRRRRAGTTATPARAST